MHKAHKGSIYSCYVILYHDSNPFFHYCRRKKKCARLRPAGFRNVVGSFDEFLNEETEDSNEEDCCNTDNDESNTEGRDLPKDEVLGQSQSLTEGAANAVTLLGYASEETYRRRFLLHQRRDPSKMLLPPMPPTAPNAPATSVATAVVTTAASERKKKSMSILQQTSSPDDPPCYNF